MELREIAEATKISIRFLQALEDDRVEILPGGIFRRSFVREYARHLGLDPDRTVAEFLYAHDERREAPARGAEDGSGPAEPSSGFYRRGKLLGAIAAFLVAGGVTAWTGLGAEPPAPAAAPAPVAAAPVVFPEDRIYPVAVPAAAQEPTRLVVTLRASEPCWVGAEVDGQATLNRTLAGGETQTLEADSRIVLSVGNAGALALRINDRPGVALGAPGEVRRDIVISRESLPSLVDEDAPVRTSDSG